MKITMDKNFPLPRVSIIIPVFNEENFIEACLNRIIEQTYPKEKMEVFVVDGVSQDKTVEIVSRIITNNQGLKINILKNPNGQRAAAMNIGIRESCSEVIARVDSRAIIPADYLEKCIDTFNRVDADNVGGIQKSIPNPQFGENSRKYIMQEVIGIAMSCFFGMGSPKFRLGKKSGYVDTVYLGCFKKSIFDKLGLFDEESAVISEDADMNQRICDAGGKVYLNKDIIVPYYPRDNFIDLWKIYFRYGGAKAGNLIKRRKLTAWRQCIPPLFVLALILLPLLGIFNGIFYYTWFLTIFSYLLLDLVFSFILSIKNSKLYLLWRLFFIFPAMHLGWGLGFWSRLTQRPRPKEYWGH
jgi:glycosyltransferase involved in cell wall biosynthesis